MFKVGDRVKEIKWDEAWNYDRQGTVTEILEGRETYFRVRFDNDKNGGLFATLGRLRLAEEICSLMPPPPLKDFM
jgi:uncharacterized protein (UPF0128 family)